MDFSQIMGIVIMVVGIILAVIIYDAFAGALDCTTMAGWTGGVGTITVTAGGSGYGTAPVTITGDGTGATATATIDTLVVDSIAVDTAGSGYTFANVAIGGNGTGATATATTLDTIAGGQAGACQDTKTNANLVFSIIPVFIILGLIPILRSSLGGSGF